jgi:thioredoxin reductase (NADPH)
MKQLFLCLSLLLLCNSCNIRKEKKEANVSSDSSKTIDLTNVQNVVIVGSGPAGLTAGIYTARDNLDPIVIEGDRPQGLLTLSHKIENWPGKIDISGQRLMQKIKRHAGSIGCRFLSGMVKEVDFSKRPYRLSMENGTEIKAKSIIIASGSTHRRLGCPGEKKYFGSGVSFCAICDARFYQDKNVAIIGGGNSALIEAEYVSHFAKRVFIIHTSETFSVEDALKKHVLSNSKITPVHNCRVKEIKGNKNGVTGVVIENKKNEKENTIPVEGVFVAIGFRPNSAFLGDALQKDAEGYLFLKDGMETSKKGVFAAGEVVDCRYRQAIVSAGDGCKAALDCIHSLRNQKD